MKLKMNAFTDPYRGDGVFVAAGRGKNHVLLALRKRLNFGFVVPNGKPSFRRLYLGFVEIQYS